MRMAPLLFSVGILACAHRPSPSAQAPSAAAQSCTPAPAALAVATPRAQCYIRALQRNCDPAARA